MTKKLALNAREWLLLSAYLDGELSKREIRQVKELLQSNPSSRMALEGLRRTRQVLHFMPQRKTPRNFTLTPEMIRKTGLSPLNIVFSYASALAGFLLVTVVAFDLFAGYRLQPVMQAAPDSQALAQEAGQVVVQAQPPIIYWGPAYPQSGAFGLGGGGEDMRAGLGGGIGGGSEEPAVIEPAPLLEAPVMQENEASPEELESPLAAPPQEQAEAAQALEPSAESIPAEKTSAETEGSQPILGIRPASERGSLVFKETAASRSADYPQVPNLRLLEAGLAIIALVSGLAALFLKRRRITAGR